MFDSKLNLCNLKLLIPTESKAAFVSPVYPLLLSTSKATIDPFGMRGRKFSKATFVGS